MFWETLRAIGPISFLTLVLLWNQPILSAQRNRIAGPIDNNRRVTLQGHIHPRAVPEYDQGPVAPSFEIPNVTIVLKQSASQQAALDQLLADQQDPSSANYHRWLTPQEYADRFGASQDDINKIVSWLGDQQLKVIAVGQGRNWVTFTGAASAVENALGTSFHHYDVNGKLHFANATEPSIPAALQGIVQSIHGLNNFRMKPPKRSVKIQPEALQPDYTSARGNHYLAPDDAALIYNIKPLYDQGIDGSGQKIVVVGQSAVDPADNRQFRSFFKLPPGEPQVTLVPNSTDPGIVSGDVDEANLDIELAGAVARKATILFVYATDVMTAAKYAVDQNLAPVLSMSYGQCEPETSTSDALTLQSWAKQANAQGMTWFAASGDAGAADCSGGSSRTANSLAVDLPAGIPEVTGVGGTEFSEGSGSYWNATGDPTTRASVLGYIPEAAWNDTTADGTPSASGGGASRFFAKPNWQSGPGVPNDGARDVPDVSLSASADHDGWLTFSGGSMQVVGGTSVGAPSFAGLAALMNQYLLAKGSQAAAGLGNINPKLYSLAQTAPSVFHDITAGNNVINVICTPRSRNCTPGSIGYQSSSGYDQVTGLGSVDAYKLVSSWNGPTGAVTRGTATMTLSSSSPSITPSDSVALTATVKSANGGTPGGSVTFSAGGNSLGTAALAGSSGTATATLNVSGTVLPAGADTVSAQYSGDASYNPASASVSITVASVQTGAMAITGVANAASFKQGFAPGMLVSVFGSQLSTATQAASSTPLPLNMAGTTVTVNGVLAPLQYVSASQLNVQIPYETPVNTTAVLKVTSNGQSTSASMPITAAAPGIFTAQSGAPVPFGSGARGQVITLFLTGAGAVSPPVGTGAPPNSGTALSNLPKPAASTVVTVGGVNAPIQFIGIPSGLVGVLQINYRVPNAAPLGPQSLVVTVGGVPSAPALLTVTP